MFINILNTSQNNKETVADIRTINEVEKDFLGNSIFQGCTQTSDYIFNTQEKFNSNLLEKANNSNDYNNHNNSASPVDELGNQNCISLEALKGKMSQDVTFDSDFKNKSKNNLDLNWQEGKVSIKKGKIKVECNYAFTPTKSSLRVRCIYCKKIYFSVKGFISHRGRCIYYKAFQNTQYESISQNCKNSNSNKYLSNSKEKSLQNNQILNSLVDTQYTENSQYNSKINSGFQSSTNEDTTLFNYNSDNRFHFDDKEMDHLSTYNTLRKVINGNNHIFELEKSSNLNSNKSESSKNSNGKIENTSFYNDKIDVENFKMYLYAAISCLPKYIVAKILKRRNPGISISIDEKSEDITKEELIDMIFAGIGQKVLQNNSDLKGETNEKLLEQKNLLNNLRCDKTEKIELELESIKSESNSINNDIKDENFQLNIPVFFRHSLPKDSEWKCYICKVPRNGKESMNMCVNCGYIYHLTCQSQANKITKNDWFCDYCKAHGNKLKPGSKFQIGELVWVNYKCTFWPAQIMEFSKEQFEVFIFHIEKRIEKSSNEILPWSKGIISIDGLASKGTFVRESTSSIMHWQSVYKAIKYYLNSLRSKQRRLPQIKKKNSSNEFKIDNKKKKTDVMVSNNSNSETRVFHPIPSGINDGLEQHSNEISLLDVSSH
ncbi:PHD finger containing protein [Cryptosporidium parvum Iowa II]|uniref:PHD finger containing protein n=2 Tax=Cryptosporidium parvum TaxID=5807 RepID=Q5CSQ8_CRYPI|nr:PHD finger containing protein [Cryptosporidium parvum Iowa II]EAK88427.1 PHD finger containing protein [Cryptosporidium parvum Iowa II]WKS76069.1 PHD finger containing protein [Cryptosporidium sp. 43IA8]